MSTPVQAALYGLLVLALIGFVWAAPYVPTQDGPQHVYNLVLLDGLGRELPEVTEHYTLGSLANPNLGFQLVGFPLLNLFSPLTVERIFLTLYLGLFAVGVVVLLSALGRPPFPTALLALPAALNFTLLMGFYSYVLAVPLLLFALATVWHLRAGGPLARFAAWNAWGIVLFWTHLVPFAAFGLALLIWPFAWRGLLAPNEEQLAGGEMPEPEELLKLAPSLGRRVLETWLLCLPMAGLLGWFLMRGGGGDVAFWRLPHQLMGDLMFFSTVAISSLQTVPGVLLLGLVLWGLWNRARGGEPRLDDVNARNAHLLGDTPTRWLAMLAVGLVLVYFASPRRFGGGGIFNERFPWMILLLLLPLLRLPAAGLLRQGFGVAAALMAAVSVSLSLWLLWPMAGDVEAFVAGRSSVPAGATVVTSRFDPATVCRTPGSSPWPRFDPLLNAGAHYGLEGAVNLGNYSALLPHFPIRFRADASTIPHPLDAYCRAGSMDWGTWPVVDYMLAWGVDADDAAVLRRSFDPVELRGGSQNATAQIAGGAARLSLWKRRTGHPRPEVRR